MIFLTGDVHHNFSGNKVQEKLGETELDIAKKYVEIVKKYNLNCTLFVTGKAMEEQPSTVRSIASNDCVEIGGHTYSAFDWVNKPLSYVFQKIYGTAYGPRFIQKRDIRKCVNTYEKILGHKMISWRTHAYDSNKTTYELLKQFGIKVVSDCDRNQRNIRRSDLTFAHLNTLGDHSSIMGGDPQSRISIEEWFDIIKGQVKDLNKESEYVTIQAHPAVMKLEDNFETFEKLCEFFREYETFKLREIYDQEG